MSTKHLYKLACRDWRIIWTESDFMYSHDAQVRRSARRRVQGAKDDLAAIPYGIVQAAKVSVYPWETTGREAEQ
jgi:hypothetical protein